ncbi:MAG: DUF1848 domain-containing protein [Lachnospiraceae bacterium]|nr:DUF1848 domain-containing protein [Lachnospiraceae bacterium]
MIIQTGNRTDIPAFYSEWFANRLREGFVLVRNPFNHQSITRYVLDPSVVDLIVFCTKNPEPMLKYMELLTPYHQYWFVTITPYGKDIEPKVPDKYAVMDTFIRLSSIVGPDHMCWRYDPIFIDETWTAARHIESFRMMCETLAGHTHTAVISFIELYEKVKRNFPEAKAVSFLIQLELTKTFVEIAREYGMAVKPCGENPDLASVGADCSGCMTQKVFENAVGQNMIFPSNPNNRKECACYITGDIGAYNSCGHFCRYCYANADRNAVIRSMKNHDPKSPLLIGHIQPGDKMSSPKQASWIDPQLRLDL